MVSIRKYRNTKKNHGMINTLRRKKLRKKTWFFSMTTNTYKTQENPGCIG
jgi:hypothetical protein